MLSHYKDFLSVETEKYGPARYKYSYRYIIRLDDGRKLEGQASELAWTNRFVIPIEDSLNFQYISKKPFNRLYDRLELNDDELEAVKLYIKTGELDSGKILMFLVNKDCFLFYNKDTKEFHCYINNSYASLKCTNTFKKQIKKYPNLINNSFVRATFKGNYLNRYIHAKCWYKYDITGEENPLLEDIGYTYTTNPFVFTCPICKNKNSPAGYVNAPKKFYNNNKEYYCTRDEIYSNFKYIIDDPNYIIKSSWDHYSILSVGASLFNAAGIHQVQIDKALRFVKKWKKSGVRAHFIIDYYSMFHKLYPNVKPISIFDLDLSKVNQMHNDLVKIYNQNKTEINNNAYLSVKSTYPDLEYQNDKFLIKYPDKISDLPAEGIALNHCVGSYVDKVLNQQAYIMFIRNIDKPNEPFITLHYAKSYNDVGPYEIVQAHGKCNSSVTEYPGVFEFIKEWAKKYNIKVTDINKVR